jgi:hypothetical protein
MYMPLAPPRSARSLSRSSLRACSLALPSISSSTSSCAAWSSRRSAVTSCYERYQNPTDLLDFDNAAKDMPKWRKQLLYRSRQRGTYAERSIAIQQRCGIKPRTCCGCIHALRVAKMRVSYSSLLSSALSAIPLDAQGGSSSTSSWARGRMRTSTHSTARVSKTYVEGKSSDMCGAVHEWARASKWSSAHRFLSMCTFLSLLLSFSLIQYALVVASENPDLIKYLVEKEPMPEPLASNPIAALLVVYSQEQKKKWTVASGNQGGAGTHDQ